jgi:hypothetical protein
VHLLLQFIGNGGKPDPRQRQGLDRKPRAASGPGRRARRLPHPCRRRQPGNSQILGPDTRIIDLGGRLILPGFNDSHVHFLMGGGSLITVHLGTANSQAEFKERVAAFAKTLPAGAWLRNGLWDHQCWTPPALPNHQLIDDVSGNHPAFLWRLDGHMALVNAQAMKLAGIDRNTKDVPGGEIERDKDGYPTGILKDAATALVERIMPPLSPEETDQAIRDADTRRTLDSKNPNGWIPDQRITVAQAVRAYASAQPSPNIRKKSKAPSSPAKSPI